MPISKFQFGTGFESEIRIGFPLFDFISDRELRAGSDAIDVPDGSIDTWPTGRDYVMDAEARWIPDGPGTAPVQTQLSGPVSWQEFLNWARDGNPFRLVPDENVPDFFVENTYLVEPRKGFGSLTTDIKRRVRLKLRNPTKDFHEAMRGILFEYAPGASLVDPVAAAFTRATAATRRGLPGSLLTAIGASELSNVLRDRHYEGTRRATLLEGLRVQLVTDPEDFSTWSTTGSITRTGGQPDPFGGTGAYLLTSNTVGANNDAIHRAVTFTADGTKAILWYMRANTSAVSQARIRDATAAVNRHVVNITWTAGVPSLATSAGAGTIFSIIPYGDGWYALAVAVDSIVAANTNDYQFHPDPLTGTGSVYLFRANAWNCTYPTSSQGPTLTTKNGDLLLFPLTGLRTQPMAIYLALLERGLRLGLGTAAGNTVALFLGSLAGGDPRLTMEGGGGNYAVSHFTAGAASDSSATRPGGAEGDVVELLLLFRSDGSVQLVRSLNFGADSASAQGAAANFPASWGANPGIALGSQPSGSNSGLVPLLACKVMPLIYAGVTRDSTAKARVA